MVAEWSRNMELEIFVKLRFLVFAHLADSLARLASSPGVKVSRFPQWVKLRAIRPVWLRPSGLVKHGFRDGNGTWTYTVKCKGTIMPGKRARRLNILRNRNERAFPIKLRA